jgi:exopolysaccharide biosynthesis polyprenyl glycosylphosphotransferase
MLRQQAKLFNRLSRIVDICILLVSLFLAFSVSHPEGVPLREFRGYAWLLLLVIPLWLYLFEKNGLYASIRRCSNGEIVKRLIGVHLLAGAICVSVVFFFHMNHFGRVLFAEFLLFALIFFIIERLLVRNLLGYFREKGYNVRNLLIVGIQEKAHRFQQLVEDHKDWGLVVAGFLQADESVPLETEFEGHPVFGYARDLIEVCKKTQIDEVVFCMPKDLIIDVDQYVRDLEEIGITVRLVLDFFDLNYSRSQLSIFHNEMPILTFSSKSLDAQQLFFKRLLDIVGALVGLAITVVAFPFIALAIKRDDPGPVFFSQDRVGMNGRIFKCWKFRTMYIDAEERKQALMDQNEMKGAIFKIKDDPRIIPVGHFLRKSSLDELPQFWNVLRGEMSLVGTRPPTPAEVEQYENWHRRRISIKPGITGLWQVSGRNAIDDFDEIVRLDLHYIDDWKFWTDIRILCKTVQVVFTREGSS